MNWEWNALYLTIPADYCRALGGLRWSAAADAVELDTGQIFAFKREIDLFIEGFSASRPLIHFGFILHLMHILAKGLPARCEDSDLRARNSQDALIIPRKPIRELLRRGPACDMLARAFAETGRHWRNAGAFAATLCREIPPVPGPGQWREPGSSQGLAMLAVPVGSGEVPPFEPAEFERRVLERLAAVELKELYHWLRHGAGPAKGADQIVRQLELTKPRTLGQVMAAMAQRQRLAGAVPFVAQLVSALALPPRRLAEQELPVGGYVDVATRGQPEHILPSQFAVDDLEFIRRFAQRELLYFRREEPHRQLKEELLILLDQGVRTWGEVRLILSAAVFALARRAESRQTPFRLALTCADGRIIDPLAVAEEELGSLLEASDLTLQPGLALERVLAEPAAAARDVVLLTHPRSLAEPEVAAAARRVAGDTRLFALSVDEAGLARLDELRGGVPLAIRQFRVDPTLAAPPVAEAGPAAQPQASFTGDVEPVGFPFRIGVAGPILHLAFDYSGNWLLIGGARGMLHAADLKTGEVETWPRGYDGHSLLTAVDAILGVAGGFVVAGRFGSKLVAMHYDLASRTARLHRLSLADSESWKWHYFLEQHSIVVRSGDICEGIDLATGAHGNQRVQQACERSQGRWPAPWLHVGSRTPLSLQQPSLHVDAGGTITIQGMPQVWKPFTPLSDGQPVLKDRRLHQAQCNGTILALADSAQDWSTPTLRLFRGQRGQTVGELPLRANGYSFMLSPTGQRLAVQIGTARVVVYDLAGGMQPIWHSPVSRCHSDLLVEQGDRWLSVQVGKFVHFFRWDGGRLLHRQTRGNKEALIKEEIAGTPLYGAAFPSRRPAAAARDETSYLWQRFTGLAAPGTYVDHFSQVTVLDRNTMPVCMFYVFREKWAAWLPDGTRLGPSTITGGPESANAAERIGRALLAHDSALANEAPKH